MNHETVQPIRISVIVPSYNSGRYLAKTLATVAKQDFPPYEVIVIDGGSKDETAEVVRAFGSLVTTFVSERDKGQLDAVRKGCERATGDVLYWLNADDVVMPGAFKLVNEVFTQHPETQVVFSDDYAFDEPKRQLYVGARVSNLTFWDRFLFYRHLCSETVFWRRELTERALPFDLTVRSATDVMLTMPILYRTRTRWLPQRLGAFRIAEGQNSQLTRDLTEGELTSLKDRIRIQIGMSKRRYQVLRWLYAPVFLVSAKLYPSLHSGFRFAYRRITGDRDRKRKASFLIDEWLNIPDEVSRRLQTAGEQQSPNTRPSH